MNADPDEGQPTTVPEPTAPAKTPPEATVVETVEDAVAETDATEAEADATEPEADEPDADEPDADEPDADEPAEAEPEATGSDTAKWDAAEDDSEATDAEVTDAEASGAEASAAEAEAEPVEAVEPVASEVAEPEHEAEAAEPEAADPGPLDPEPATTSPAATTPLVAGRYRLVSEIGGGAMGVVWRARDEVLGRDVAVKELRPDHGMSGAQVRISHQRARREGRIAARLQHPNAVVIYDVAEHDGRPYLIMEYVPSQSLGDILATGAVLTPTEVTSIGAQLASALTAAHERGIVHRDIKPGNVLMTSDGTVKLTDFGISRAAGDATVTATGEILGTPAYTAPEVAQGHPVAFPADVFSLGATLYAAVEGTPPFGEDANAMATLLRVVRNEIRHPKRSGPLTDTIMWMLNPEPVDRPTMKQAWQNLDQLAAKPLPVADIRASAPVTKAFEAPSPTLVVPDPTAARRGGSMALPEQPIVHPLASLATPAAAPMSTPTAPPPSTPISTPLPTPDPTPDPTPTPAPISTPPPTSSSSVIAATPTSAMAAVPTPTRNTELAKSKAKKSPAAPPPPTDDHSALTPASPPPNRRSRMPLAIAVCVVGTAVLIVAIVVAMNSGDKSSPNQPAGHGSTAPTQSAASHPTTSGSSTPSQSQTSSQSQAPTAPSTKPSSSPSSTPSTSASTPSTSATDTATQMKAFITNYYGLLPNNTTAAWPQMTAAYQTNVARSFSYYQSWWGGYQQVTVSDVVATLPSTVVATIHYVAKDGTRTDERTSFGLVRDGSSFKIDTSHVIG